MWQSTILLVLWCVFSIGHPIIDDKKWIQGRQQKYTKPFVIVVPDIEHEYSSPELETAANSPVSSVQEKPQIVVEVIKSMELDFSHRQTGGETLKNYDHIGLQNVPYIYSEEPQHGREHYSYISLPSPYVQYNEHLFSSASARAPSSTSCNSVNCRSLKEPEFSNDFDLESRTLLGNTLIRKVKKNVPNEGDSGHRLDLAQVQPYTDVKSRDILKLVPANKNIRDNTPIYPVNYMVDIKSNLMSQKINHKFQFNQNLQQNTYSEHLEPTIERPERNLMRRRQIKRKPVSHWDFGLKTANVTSTKLTHYPNQHVNLEDQQNYGKMQLLSNYYLLQSQEGLQQKMTKPQAYDVGIYKNLNDNYQPGQVIKSYEYKAPLANQIYKPIQQGNKDEILLQADYYPKHYTTQGPQNYFEKRPIVWETIYLPLSLIQRYLLSNKAVFTTINPRLTGNAARYYESEFTAPFTSYPKAGNYISVRNTAN